MQDPWRFDASNLLDRLQQDYPEEFLHTLRRLIDERLPRARGRRKGADSAEDAERLARLEKLLRDGMEDEAAVQLVARDDPGESEKSTRRRLRRKLGRVKAALARPGRAEKDEILRKAFAERFETWDFLDPETKPRT